VALAQNNISFILLRLNNTKSTNRTIHLDSLYAFKIVKHKIIKFGKILAKTKI